jgi:hypothetical protein
MLTLRASVLRAARDVPDVRAAGEALLAAVGKRPFYPIEHAFRLARAGDLLGAIAALRAAEERLRVDGLGGMDAWLRRLAERCRMKGRAELAAYFRDEARSTRAGAHSTNAEA